jgi:hypothetical protein
LITVAFWRNCDKDSQWGKAAGRRWWNQSRTPAVTVRWSVR